MIKIEDWVQQNNLTVTYNLPWIKVEGLGDLLLLGYRDKVLDSDFNLILTPDELDLGESADYILYQFGDRFYYTDIICKPHLTEFRYVGPMDTIMPQADFPFLGIHGGYDLCNGSRTYGEWCKKAKFMGITTLGIAEENTLAGTLSFQESCEKDKIRPIIGETVNVRRPNYGDYKIKLYCKDRENGWKNLLMVNTFINVFNEAQFITEEQLFKHTSGLICVLNPETSLDVIYEDYKDKGFDLYYQLDFTEWDSQDKDVESLINLESYLLEYKDRLKPLLISDAYYLDKQDSHIRKFLNKTGSVGFKNYSKNHYFKNVDDYFLEALEIFKDDEKCENLITDAIVNTIECFDGVGFDLVTPGFHLPSYVMSAEESARFDNVDDLLRFYIDEGFDAKVTQRGLNAQVYRDRIELEFDIIKRGGFVNYFLIIIDLYKYADSVDIWYGIGRGSAAGCLISYLTGIVGIDPIEYNLLFERFLSEGRITTSLPDIDTDWAGSRRDDIKNYLEKKYGGEYVTSIGTYGTFKLKNTLKDIGRDKGVESSTMNYITKFLDIENLPGHGQQQFHYYYYLFHQSVNSKADKNGQLRQFIHKHPNVIKDLPLLLNQAKNTSIHAAGVVLVPSEDGTLYEQMPVKKHNGVLISEWEGYFIDKAGFVKFDILGVNQFDKFENINKAIKRDTGKDIRFKDIPLDDEKVFELFRKGYNEDVFQLGGVGLKGYCKMLQPSTIEDLTATVAIYRPGPIESGAHLSYMKRKNGLEEVIFDPGCEQITRNTYGLIIYQEQTMQVCQQVGGFSLVEADDVRRAMAKMKVKYLAPYKEIFIKRALEKGYDEDLMIALWGKMETFASYTFNRSHAACYGVTGYYSQWFKANYPLQFWTTSLQFSEPEKIQDKISEIKNGSDIDITSININYSDYSFRSNVETNAIYWALPSVKWVGDKIVEDIINERTKNGLFFSLEEFYERMKDNKPNKRAMYNLITCGAFDDIEGVVFMEQRYEVMQKFAELVKDKMKESYLEMKSWIGYQWTLRERELTGFGYFDFKDLILNSTMVDKSHLHKDNFEILSEDTEGGGRKSVLVCGLVEDVVIRGSKKGDFAQVQVRDNSESVYLTIWNETYTKYKESIDNSKNKVCVFGGNIEFDSYKHRNVVKSTAQSKLEIL